MISIVLADDHHIVRKGLRSLLNGEIDFEVVGEAASGVEAVNIVESLKPDILVLDLMMPGLNGLGVTARLAVSCPDTGIIILSMHSNEAYIYQALCSGAKAYILKENTADELITAIRQVSKGNRYLGSAVPERILEECQKASKTGKKCFSPKLLLF